MSLLSFAALNVLDECLRGSSAGSATVNARTGPLPLRRAHRLQMASSLTSPHASVDFTYICPCISEIFGGHLLRCRFPRSRKEGQNGWTTPVHRDIEDRR